MTEITLKINQKIEIVDDNVSYKCNIQDIDGDVIMIDMPVSQGKYYTMHRNSLIEFFVVTENEITKCRSKVLGFKLEGRLRLFVLTFPEVIGRVQRREFFRLPIAMEARYVLLPESINNINTEKLSQNYLSEMKKCITVDISGGGLKIVTKEECTAGRKLVVSLSIPDEIKVICSVIRCWYTEQERNYSIALRFENISERVRDKIIRFVFAKMREQTKLVKDN
jgi:c-di-GMP-binding flagellar brake protein YcgR